MLLLDHVVKDRESRGRWPIGGQHKLAGIDVAYSLRLIEPFARGRTGRAAVKVEKDRPGRVREFAEDDQVAMVSATSHPDERVRIALEPPEPTTRGTFRPTVLMERASKAVEARPGLSVRSIRAAIRGARNDTKDLAVELLVTEGYVGARPEGQARRHYSLRPYRADEDPVATPCPTVPDRASGTGEGDRARVPHPFNGGTGTGHTTEGTNKRPTVPRTATSPSAQKASSNVTGASHDPAHDRARNDIAAQQPPHCARGARCTDKSATALLALPRATHRRRPQARTATVLILPRGATIRDGGRARLDGAPRASVCACQRPLVIADDCEHRCVRCGRTASDSRNEAEQQNGRNARGESASQKPVETRS